MLYKKKILVILLAICTVFTGNLGVRENLSAQETDMTAIFEETLNNDKTEATVKMNLQYDEDKFQVDKIIQSDKSEILPQENNPLVTSTYISKENGNLDFEVKYTDIASKEARSEIFSYEVKEVKKVEAPVKNEQEQPKEDTKETNKQDDLAKRDLGKPTAVGTKIDDSEDSYGAWKFTIIDEANKLVRVDQIEVPMDLLGGEYSDMFKTPGVSEMDDFSYPDGIKGVKLTMPDHVIYNGSSYTVATYRGELTLMSFSGDGSKSSDWQGHHTAAYILPDTITKIEGQTSFWGDVYLYELYIPDSVTEVVGAFLMQDADSDTKLTKLHLPKNANYSSDAFNYLNTKDSDFTIPEADEGIKTKIGGFALSYMRVKTINIPRSMESILAEYSLSWNSELEKLSIWNTTKVDATAFEDNNENAYFLIKSDTAINMATDELYKIINSKAVNHAVYGKTEVKTTSDEIQTLKPGKTTTFAVSTEKSIGNDVVDKTVDFTTDWIDGGYTYSIAGNTSTNTVMNGDTLTVGSDESADSFTVTATSTFDSSKKVTFTINVDKTKAYVVQAIDYSSWYPGDNPNGKVVKKFETLQEAFDFDYYRATFCDQNSIVIELLTDITLDETIVMKDDFQWTRYFKQIRTAPTKNHLASGAPSLYTGSSQDGRAILSRGINNKGALIEWTTSRENSFDNFSNIILDGKKSDGLSGDALIITSGMRHSNLSLTNVKLTNNNNTLDNGGAIRVGTNAVVSSITLDNSTISDCETKYSGGGIYSSRPGNIVTYDSSHILNCSAQVNGGAIAAYTGVSSLNTAGEYKGNKANRNGGAIYTEVASAISAVDNIRITKTEISNNSAGSLGSGIYFSPSNTNDEYSYNLTIFGAMEAPAGITHNIRDTVIVKDNIDYENKGNIYIEQEGSLKVFGDLSLASEIGVTFAGVDKNGRSRMEPGAIIGKWSKFINGPIENGLNYIFNSNRNGLTGVFRDTNNQSLGYIYADEGGVSSSVDDIPDMLSASDLVWPESPMNFKVMDEADSTKLLENAEFKLYQCTDSTHDHSKDPVTNLAKDSACWNVLKTVTSDVNGYVDFGDLSTGQYMLVLSISPTGYSKVDGQWFINVNNSPNKKKPQIYTNRLSVTKRGDVSPPNLTLALDSDGYFESGKLLLSSEYLITFDAMGGTMNAGEATQTVGLNEIIVKPTNPVYAGHGFEGWYTDDQFATEWNFNTPVNTSMTLYAKWNPIVYHLHFDANTGVGTMNDINYGIDEELTLSKNTFTKVGFEFTGWNTRADGSGTSYIDEAAIDSTPANSITLYAQWKEEGPSVYIQIPKAIDLKDDTDGYAKQSDEVKIVKNVEDAAWYPDQDIQIRASTSITLINDKSLDTYDVSVFKSDNTQYTDGATSLMILNVIDEARQSETFTLKTRIDNTKIKSQYHGIMRFIIEFMP